MTTAIHVRVTLLSVLLAVFALQVWAGEGTQPAAGQPQQQTVTPEQAFAIMSEEAQKGNAAAMLTLGTLYERGIGTPRNFTQAFKWYKNAAAAGIAEAYYNVGVCYEIGMGNDGDAAQAFIHFEKSAELSLPQGYYKLATLYLTGFGVEKNEAWGVELLKRAASAGHMIAANDLGVVYYTGMYGQAKDENQAFAMFNRAAELGNAEAMKNIAIFYRDGIGRPADPKEELKWYILARRAGFPAGVVDNASKEIIDYIGPDQTKEIESSVDAWIADFQKRQ